MLLCLSKHYHEIWFSWFSCSYEIFVIKLRYIKKSWNLCSHKSNKILLGVKLFGVVLGNIILSRDNLTHKKGNSVGRINHCFIPEYKISIIMQILLLVNINNSISNSRFHALKFQISFWVLVRYLRFLYLPIYLDFHASINFLNFRMEY